MSVNPDLNWGGSFVNGSVSFPTVRSGVGADDYSRDRFDSKRSRYSLRPAYAGDYNLGQKYIHILCKEIIEASGLLSGGIG